MVIDNLEFILTAKNNASSELNKAKENVKNIGNEADKASGSVAGVGKAASKASSGVKKLANSFGRIMMYRALRSVIRAITSELKEGLENAYLFSSGINERLSVALDGLASSSLKMKNQLGSAFGELVQLITPALQTIISWVTAAANAISQLFAALGGHSSYLKAVDTSTTFSDNMGSAAESAKKIKDYLMGFDELNVINPNDSTGSGGSSGASTDASKMFENTELSSWAKWIKDNVGQKINLGSLSVTFDDLKMLWADLGAEGVAKMILKGILGLFFGIAGFELTGSKLGALTASIAGIGVAAWLSSLIFDNDKTLSQTEVHDLLKIGLAGLCGAAVTWATKSSVLGLTVSAAVTAMLMGVLFPAGTKLGGDSVITLLAAGLGALVGGVIGWKLFKTKGAVIGASVGASVSAGLMSIFFTPDGTMSEDETRLLLNTAIGAVLGGVLGFTAGGGLKGAFLGATVGASISLVLSSAMFDKGSGTANPQSLADALNTLLPGITGLALGAKLGTKIGSVGGVTGALIGLTLGVTLSLAVQDITMDNSSVTKSSLNKAIDGITSSGAAAAWATYSGFATGGFPDNGELFIAREAGAEMVGSLGGHTAVANNDQIVEGISAGVYNAVSAAMSNNTGASTNLNVYLDGKQIYASVKKTEKNHGAKIGTGGIVYA